MNKNRSRRLPMAVAGALLVLAMALPWLAEYAPAIAGVRCYGVHGGSMEPVLHDGDLAYAAGTDPAGLSPGDVIVFRDWSGGAYVIHRVVSNMASSGQVVTKGDANGQPDALPVPYGSVMGRMCLRLPGAGRIVTAMTSGPGACASLMFGGAGLMLLAMAWASPGRRRGRAGT